MRIHAGLPIAFGILACAEPPMQPKVDTKSALDSAVLTASVLSSLDKNAQFQLPTGSPGEIPVDVAERLARIWIRDFASFTLTSFELERGSPISAGQLVVCGRSFYAKSPYVEQPDIAVRKYFGPYWMISICENETPVISLAVSALNTDLLISNDTIRWPAVHGSDWFPVGLPKSTSEFPMSPEEAVKIIADSTGRRVDRVPELIMAGPPYMPQLARWRVHFESEATAINSVTGDRFAVSELFVARSLRTGILRIMAAHGEQPDFKEIQSFVSGAQIDPESRRDYRVVRRPDVPVSLVAITAFARD